MASEQAVIHLKIDGADAVREALERVDNLTKTVEGRHVIDISAEAAKRTLMELDASMKQLRRTMQESEKDSDAYKTAADKLKVLRKEYDSATSAVKVWNNGVQNSTKERQKEAKAAKAEADAIKAETRAREQEAKAAEKQAKADAKAAAEAEKNAQREQRAAEKIAQANAKKYSFGALMNRGASITGHIGSAMQSFGNALTTFASPFSQITSGMAMGAGYKLLNQFSEGLNSSFERADVMRKYPRVMESMGYSAEKAQASIDKLDQSVQGLPTSLVDMVSMSQRFTSTLGDLDKGTDLAIAANNAFLASMSTDTQKYQGMMQLQDVIGGKDMNAREWASLANSMLPAIRMMGESLGYEGEALDEYVAKVQQGKIANEDFVDTLIKAGTDADGKIRKIAEESLDTWEAFFSRIGTAASKFGYKGIIEPLNELVKTVTSGKFESVNLLLDDFIYNGIDKMKNSVADWIKAHPEEITDFFNTLANINWKAILDGVAQGFLLKAQLLELVSGLLDGNKLSKGLGWFISLGGSLGRAFTIVGGFLKGTRHIWGALGAGIFKLGKGSGLFGVLGKLFGKKKVIEEAGKTAKSVPTVADTFRNAFSALEGLMKASGAILLVSGTGFVAFESAKRILQNIKEMSDMLKDGDWSNAPLVATGVIAGIGAFVEIFNYIGTVLGTGGLLSVAIASAASLFVSGTIWADTEMILDGLENIKQSLLKFDEIGSAITNMKGLQGINVGEGSKIASSVQAIRDIADALIGKNGGPSSRGEYSLGLPTFTADYTNSLTNLSNAVSKMQEVVAQFNTLASLTVNDPSDVVEDIKEACNKLQGIRVSKGLMKQSERIAESLIQVRRIAYHINKLAGVSVNAGGFADTIAQIKSALESLKGMSQTVTLDIKLKLGAGFRTSVNGVVKQLKNAKKDIEAYKKPIAFIVPVNVTFSVVTNAASAIAKMKNERQRVANARNNIKTPMTASTGGRASRNGVLYRSGGGSAFQPRGTDKIPAMLTEGEYVHKKQAVDFFGVDFMRKVNNLDVKGAMQSLLTKAGTSVGVGRQSIVNNTVNNNQRITQNINTNNPNFAGARMGRFVGAL